MHHHPTGEKKEPLPPHPSHPSHPTTYDEFTKAHPTYGDVSGLRYGDVQNPFERPSSEEKGDVNE